jgi:hypothetical protein
MTRMKIQSFVRSAALLAALAAATVPAFSKPIDHQHFTKR